MRRLSGYDTSSIIGREVEGYEVIKARIKGGPFSDSDCYGIILCVNKSGRYVTWQFHLADEEPKTYWGRYHMENREAAYLDFDARE
jgi:hypothetical protein